MGFNIGGQTISASGTGIALNTNTVFSSGGLSTVTGLPGFNAFNNSGGQYYSLTTGTPTNPQWTSGQLVNATGVFTATVAGYYFVSYDGIHNGGQNIPAAHNTYGYGGWAKNGALSYYNHWNVSTSAWNQGGAFAIFSLAVGDTVALFINRAPTPLSEAGATGGYNYGLYPSQHGSLFAILIG
jgi:hypothetical protein